jgi:DNA-binding transcriptional regulator YiaG
MNGISSTYTEASCAHLARVADDIASDRTVFEPRLMRELRLRAGVPEAVIAVAVGCSVSAVAKWEAGRSAPSPLLRPRIERIIAALGELSS